MKMKRDYRNSRAPKLTLSQRLRKAVDKGLQEVGEAHPQTLEGVNVEVVAVALKSGIIKEMMDEVVPGRRITEADWGRMRDAIHKKCQHILNGLRGEHPEWFCNGKYVSSCAKRVSGRLCAVLATKFEIFSTREEAQIVPEGIICWRKNGSFRCCYVNSTGQTTGYIAMLDGPQVETVKAAMEQAYGFTAVELPEKPRYLRLDPTIQTERKKDGKTREEVKNDAPPIHN